MDNSNPNVKTRNNGGFTNRHLHKNHYRGLDFDVDETELNGIYSAENDGGIWASPTTFVNSIRRVYFNITSQSSLRFEGYDDFEGTPIERFFTVFSKTGFATRNRGVTASGVRSILECTSGKVKAYAYDVEDGSNPPTSFLNIEKDLLEIGRELPAGGGDDVSLLFEAESLNMKFPNDAQLKVDGIVLESNKVITGDGDDKPSIVSFAVALDVCILERSYANQGLATTALGAGKAYYDTTLTTFKIS